MNYMKNENILRKLTLAVLLMAVPAIAAGQKKTPPAPKPSAPAAKPAAKPSTPAHNTSTPSHGTTNTSHGTSTTSHGSTNASHGTTNTSHGTTNTSHGTTNTSHGTTSNTSHGTSNTSHGPTNNASHGASNASHGSTNVSHNTPNGAHQKTLSGGGTATIRKDGSVRSINKNGMQISHGLHGGRTVVGTHNGARVVSMGHRGGYVQRAYVTRGGRSYYSRTYYYHGGYRSGVYRGYYYGGRPYYGYYPGYYYGSAYYGWAYNPWAAPVAYGWGWGGAPWYGYYGAYYAPYPVYPSAAFWLTDYLIAASLQSAYEAQAAANALLLPMTPDGTLVASLMPLAATGADATKLSPDVKKDIADEVKTTLAAEQAEAAKGGGSSGAAPATSNEAPPALDPNFRTFVVSSDLTLVVDGEECALSDGDVIKRTSDTADGDGNVNVKVVASTKTDCAIGKEGPVSTDDLQEMYNHFREGLKDGMGDLAKKQGTGGLPKSPDTATVNGDVPAPPPDKSAEKSIQDQQSSADQTEAEVKQEAASGGGSQ